MVTKNFTKSDFGILYDTLSIDERNEMINKNGNKENWISYGGERMYKRVPLKTDSSGYFELTYIGGFCPEYKLRIKKIGYKEVLVSRDTINPDALEIQLEKQ